MTEGRIRGRLEIPPWPLGQAVEDFPRLLGLARLPLDLRQIPGFLQLRMMGVEDLLCVFERSLGRDWEDLAELMIVIAGILAVLESAKLQT